MNRARRANGVATPFRWKRNALLHSFRSYRLAVTHDAVRTALEAGNSPTIIFRYYRELVIENEAKAWFGVMPPSQVTNVLPMPASSGM